MTHAQIWQVIKTKDCVRIGVEKIVAGVIIVVVVCGGSVVIVVVT